MLALELERIVQFPRLPLAKTVILTGTEMQHNRKYEVEGRANLRRRWGVSEVQGEPRSAAGILGGLEGREAG
jgi:hypothetical protein